MKTSSAQTSSTGTASSDLVTLSLDMETLIALNAASEAGFETASSVLLVSDDSTRA